uniref:Uncharacterized AAA domain-containing protein ycf46 n=1 Tax=Lophocladia kuetzingii TaxID=675577 RepID=A0A1Z1MN86_9FLOR|nr:hypothetical protein [Lophocladia kuetzingii]ARW67543.1 hypothetical protein [Lophocladia kuetzingii]
MNLEKEIEILLSSNNFYIYIITEEEERLEYILQKISNHLFNQKISSWNFIDGYYDNPNYTTYGIKNPLEALEIIEKSNDTDTKIFLLKDFDLFINDLSISRKIKNLYRWLKDNKKYIIISGNNQQIPKIIKEYIKKIKLPLPNRKEIAIEIERFLQILKIKEKLSIEILINVYQGFTINRIRQSISEIITTQKSNQELFNYIIKEKNKLIQETEILDLFYFNEELVNIGGLNNLKKWLKIRRYTFTNQAKTYGVKVPQGILLVGIQGTGKSLSAKAIASEWQLPLLKLNISKIFNGILGESEKNIQKIIEICEHIAPCILWIDEIDKIFNQQINNDSGTTTRVTNIFLTWLSEKKKSVFIIATANTINNIPIEMLRKGRFDEIFFVDLPNFEERISIFKIQLAKVRPLTWYKYNIYYLSKISKKFSGAEIEQSIIEAMYIGFYEKREFTTIDIITSIQNVVPLAITEQNKINQLREWGYSGKTKLA